MIHGMCGRLMEQIDTQADRIYLPQYSFAPVLKQGGMPLHIEEPILKDGRRVS